MRAARPGQDIGRKVSVKLAGKVCACKVGWKGFCLLSWQESLCRKVGWKGLCLPNWQKRFASAKLEGKVCTCKVDRIGLCLQNWPEWFVSAKLV